MGVKMENEQLKWYLPYESSQNKQMLEIVYGLMNIKTDKKETSTNAKTTTTKTVDSKELTSEFY
mgnify:CR=1 FL=1